MRPDRKDNPSYSVDGIVYSAFTEKPARPIPLSEAANRAGVSVASVKRWWNKDVSFPRTLDKTFKSRHVLDYEFDHYMEFVRGVKRVPRSWRRAIRKLKAMGLIDSDALRQALAQLRDKPWSDLARRCNSFGDSEIKAYRRGIEDAIHALCSTPLEVYDYVPEVGQKVDCGACVGVITQVTSTSIVVEGIYTYPDDRPTPLREHWRNTYKLEDVLSADTRPHRLIPNPKSKHRFLWNFENIPHTWR